MFAKTRSFSFIDRLIIEVEGAVQAPLQVTLKSEDGQIWCKTENRIHAGATSIDWEGLGELPYGIYTVECSQGKDTVEMKTVKRI